MYPIDRYYTRHVTGGYLMAATPGEPIVTVAPTIEGSILRFAAQYIPSAVLSIYASDGASGSATLALSVAEAVVSGALYVWDVPALLGSTYDLQADTTGTLGYLVVSEVVR